MPEPCSCDFKEYFGYVVRPPDSLSEGQAFELHRKAAKCP